MVFDVEIKASVAKGNAAKLKSHPRASRTWKSNGQSVNVGRKELLRK